MKIRLWKRLARPIHVQPKDTVTLMSGTKVLMIEEIGREMVFDAVCSFDVEDGEFGAKDGIGGAFLDTGGQ